jgi:ketosteroid isomerase-like protein
VGTAENKQLMQHGFAELANGNGQPFMDALANDARWTVIGSSPWSRTYEGKRAITQELMRPLFRQFADQYKARAIRIIADDDVVVVEARGEVTTKSGKPYNQTYCYIFQVADGKRRQVTPHCWERILPKLDPRIMVPTHYDNVFSPLGRPLDFVRSVDLGGVPAKSPAWRGTPRRRLSPASTSSDQRRPDHPRGVPHREAPAQRVDRCPARRTRQWDASPARKVARP